MIWIERVIVGIVWVYANWYLIRNRKAVRRMFRGYDAYEAWKMRDWVAGWEDTFNAECGIRNETNAEFGIRNAE